MDILAKLIFQENRFTLKSHEKEEDWDYQKSSKLKSLCEISQCLHVGSKNL